MNKPNQIEKQAKRVSIIGSLKPAPTYEEWEQFMLSRFSPEDVSEFIITPTFSSLNSYVRKFGKSHNIKIKPLRLDLSLPIEDARLQRNKELVNDTDYVVIFTPEQPDVKQSNINLSKSTNKDALVVVNSIVFHTISKPIMEIKTIKNQESLLNVSKDELISVEEEVALTERAKQGDENALAQLIKVNQRFVRRIAEGFEGRGLTLEELINEGNEGLKAACMKYDPTKGFKFITYAVWFIRQSIFKALATK